MPRLHSGVASIKLTYFCGTPHCLTIVWHHTNHQNNTSLFPEVLWQQPPEISVETSKLVNINDDPTIENTQNTHTLKQRNDVESQTTPLKQTLAQTSRKRNDHGKIMYEILFD